MVNASIPSLWLSSVLEASPLFLKSAQRSRWSPGLS